MWERADLKRRAKNVLKRSYWKAFLVSIVMGIVSSGMGGGTGFDFNWSQDDFNMNFNFKPFSNSEFPLAAIIFVSVFAIVLIAVLAIRILLGYTLEVGGRRYFIQGAQGDINMGYLGYGFKDGRYFSIVKTMFLKGLFVFLWGLLLIIPGIIKSYAYSMVPYILADNPGIGHKRALELSNHMTRGEKWNIFVLELSFLGWYFLGALLCGIGVMFVAPYDNATRGELYLDLRKQAIEKGYCDYTELNLIREVKVIE